MWKNITKIVGIIILLFAILFMVTCAFQNCRKDTGPEPPESKYTVIIEVTGNKYFTNKLTDAGGIVTLYGYYELVKDKYVLKDITLPLDRKLFGDIEVIVND